MSNETTKARDLIVRAAFLAITSGLLAGGVVGLAMARPYLVQGFFGASLPVVLSVVNSVLPFVVLIVAVWVAIVLLVRSWFESAWVVTLVAAFLFLALWVVAGFLGAWELLPSVLVDATPRSRAGRRLWLVVEAAVGILAAGGIMLWTRRAVATARRARLAPVAALVALVAALNVAGFATTSLAKPPPGSVIVVLIDCLRVDHVGVHGYGRPTTPNLDRFAADAVRFDQAISQSTYTKSSIASLFTGLNPHRHGVFSGGRQSDVLAEGETTLAEAFLDAGWLTGAWIEQAHLRPSTGFAQGFVTWNDRQGSVVEIHDTFLEWLRRVGRGQRFFAYLHSLDLHDPYRPPPPWDTLYADTIDVYDGIDFRQWGKHLEEIQKGLRPLDDDDVRQLIALYDALVTYIDDDFGRLVARLKDEGLYDDTTIVVTSDHGDAFMEHGVISHSTVPYEELIRVPLMIKLPGGRRAGTVVGRQVRLVDVLPTLLDVHGLPLPAVPGGLDGTSLAPLWEADDPREVPFPGVAVSEVAYDPARPYPRIAIREEGGLKYIHFREVEKDELYDLAIDPGERRNIIAEHPERAEAFRRVALEMVRARQEKGTRSIRLDEESVDDLKALGYIQ